MFVCTVAAAEAPAPCLQICVSLREHICVHQSKEKLGSPPAVDDSRDLLNPMDDATEDVHVPV